jgi:hypothetical protein
VIVLISLKGKFKLGWEKKVTSKWPIYFFNGLQKVTKWPKVRYFCKVRSKMIFTIRYVFFQSDLTFLRGQNFINHSIIFGHDLTFINHSKSTFVIGDFEWFIKNK